MLLIRRRPFLEADIVEVIAAGWLRHVGVRDAVREPGSVHLGTPGKIAQPELARAEHDALNTAGDQFQIQNHRQKEETL